MESNELDLPPLTQWIEDYVRKAGETREYGSGNYVTTLTRCPLEWVLKRAGHKEDAMSPRGSETLVAGNEREVRTLQMLAKAGHPLLGAGDIPLLGMPTDVQTRVVFNVGEEPHTLQFSGRTDGHLYWNGKKVLVEIKTFNTRQWGKFLADGPPRRYRIQTMFYMRALGLDKACIMGQCRDTEERAERWVFYDQKLVDEVNRAFSRALAVEMSIPQNATEKQKENALSVLGWCEEREGTYYTVKDEVTGESRPAKTGLVEAIQEYGEGYGAGYCGMAHVCPLLKKGKYKRVIKEGFPPGWFRYKGDAFNETLGMSAGRQKRPPKEFYKED